MGREIERKGRKDGGKEGEDVEVRRERGREGVMQREEDLGDTRQVGDGE